MTSSAIAPERGIAALAVNGPHPFDQTRHHTSRKDTFMNPLLAMLSAALLLTAPMAVAHGIAAGDLELIHPNIPAPSAMAKSAAGYVVIANEGSADDRLIAVETPVAAVAELHTTEHGADGVARMIRQDGITIPAGDIVALEPGGFHIMLMGLTRPLTEGELHPVTFIFERAGRIETTFQIDPPGGGDHSQHDHSAVSPGAEDTSATAQIATLLMAQFDRADAPLQVAPIIVQGDVAVAGWSQDGNAGRAFLRRDAQGWVVELCAGESLLQPASFMAQGLSRTDAETLAQAVATAEAGLEADLTARLDRFEGTIVIGRAGMVGQAHGAAHGG